MLNSLIIGNTSQLNYFFPEEYERISSRDIKIDANKRYKKIYLLFAEQRTFMNKDENFFNEINVDLTLDVINKIKNNCERVVVFSTSELWNNINGPVHLDMGFDYNYTPYIRSKHNLSNELKEKKEYYDNIDIIYPFNFNSIYRKEGFLFSKIFDSIINKKKISIGDISFNRDIIHPTKIVNKIIDTNNDQLIGSGELINIYDFVKDLYKRMDLDINDYVEIDNKNNLSNKRKEYYSLEKHSSYDELLNLTIKDINTKL